jgi:hypothetical protein
MQKMNHHHKKRLPIANQNRLIIIFMTIIMNCYVFGQEQKKIEQKKLETHFPKQFYSKKTYSGNTGIGINVNYTDFRGINSEISICKYLDNKMIKGIVNYEYSSLLNMNHMSFGGGATYNINPLKNKAPDCIYFTVGGGLYVSHDMLDIDKSLGESFVRNSTNVGAIVNVDNQLMISKKSAFVVSGYFNYNFITQFSQTKFWGGIGYRYNF